MTSPLIIAHRGDLKHAPENTLAAFKVAIEKGADAIEFDVHRSHDGALVVHHDHSLERTTNGRGQIGDHTLEELRLLDAGSWFDPVFNSEGIPTLAEVLQLGQGKTRFEIELRHATLPFLKAVIDEIKSYGVTKDVEITSPHIPLLQYVRSLQVDLSVGYFVPPFPTWKPIELGIQHLAQWMALLDAQVTHLPAPMLTQQTVDFLHEEGYQVHGANLNAPEQIRNAFDLGIDQFTTDELELALKLRTSLSTHATR